MTSLICYALVPPSISDNPPSGLSAIYVLAESVDAYKAADDHGTTLGVQAKSFTTQDKATAIEEMSTINCQLSTKVVRDGQLLILRDGKIYDMTGKEVK